VERILRAFWAKTSAEGDDTFPQGTHPLACHLLDAASTAEALWDRALSPATRRLIARATGGNLESARRTATTLAAVHDLGKATPAFARKHAPSHDTLVAHGLRFPSVATETNHALLGDYLVRIHRQRIVANGDPDLAKRAAEIVAGHHGTFRTAEAIREQPVKEGAGLRKPHDEPWRAAQAMLLDRVADAMRAGGVGWGVDSLDATDRPARAALAGLVIVADWLASSEDDFPYATAPELPNLNDYLQAARERAHRLLDRLAWHDLPAPDPALPFDRLFGLAGGPNALQAATRAPRPDGPALVVVEAPMGLGKTEAALDLFDRAARATGQNGIYVGLPTQATANGLFDRLASFVRRRHPHTTANVQLLHGQAQLAAAFAPLVTPDATIDREVAPTGIHDDGRSDGNVVAAMWFQGRRRGLLAPFGAGTVDQAMMAALRTRFLPLRLIGLAGKVVVVDEVHAYDVYMTTIIERLLAWLAALDCTVVLLSATLPRARRDDLAEAYRAGLMRHVPRKEAERPPLAITPYPRVTWVTAKSTRTDAFTLADPSRRVRLWRRPDAHTDLGAFGQWLAATLATGGCAVVICTTVRRAQALHRALSHWFDGDADDGDPTLDLFHAHFPFAWREAIELRVRRRFGAPGRTVANPNGDHIPVRRPNRAVLVATQVVEQSLDLDFDLLVTEPAPGDLLLQRMGRVHRHNRDERPPGLEVPTACLLEPPHRADGTPDYGRDQVAVYAEAPLLRTAIALAGRDDVVLPDDIDAIVEATYAKGRPDDVTDAWAARLDDADAAITKQAADEAILAEARLVPWPWTSSDLHDLTTMPNGGALAEDDPTVHQFLRAQTRLGDEAVALVCLLNDGDGVRACGDPIGTHLPADAFDTAPGQDATQRLLRAVVGTTDRGLVPTLRAMPAPRGWACHPLLRDARALTFQPDPSGTPDAWFATVGAHALRLDRRQGLTVERTTTTTPLEATP
jgi:CRISPR-associated endonuclease/helicase Cas3